MCKNPRERVMQFLTSPSEEEERKLFGHLATFWFSTFAMLYCTNGCVVRHETLENER